MDCFAVIASEALLAKTIKHATERRLKEQRYGAVHKQQGHYYVYYPQIFILQFVEKFTKKRPYKSTYKSH
jgi:hypothetical protein